ncbi:MAG TPA: tripartite tricarboxylate transporter substrate-binding protein [Alphaproteobacteria bacterium]|nr:tripartite tricarboxylate transporter substrate-binding protein [Alphaproteobacteria bacterium]
MTRESRVLFAALSLCVGIAASPAKASDADVAGFYKGKTIEFIIGSAAGGSYDQWARLIGRHMGKHIPGNPTFLPRNMPGAGQIIATNYLFNKAPKDGTAIGIFSRNVPTQALLKHPSIQFKTAEFNWIGSPELTNRVCVARKGAKVQKAEDIFKHELIVGGAGVGTTVSTSPVVLKGVLGMNFRVIEGYKGANDVILAIERGEVEGICQTISGISSTKPDWLEKGDLIPLFNLEQKPVPELPGVPSVFNYVKTLEQRQRLAFFFSSTELGRPIAAPPGVPAERVQALRQGFEASMKDPALLSEAKHMGLEVTMVTGQQLAELLDELSQTPIEIVKEIQAVTQSDGKD